MSAAPLPPGLPVLLRVSVAVVLGDWSLLRELRLAAGPGFPDVTWREAVLQTHLFAGFPRLVEAFGVLDEAGGLGTPGATELAPPRDEAADIEAGYHFFEQVYGHRAPRVRAMLEGYHPEWAGWVLGHAYGRVLTRPGIPAAERELLAVVCLAALGQDRQLAGHARGAVRCGAAPAALVAALDTVADLLSPDSLARARRVLDTFGVVEEPPA
ncbi:MAG: carboxymuconolactone decarboxylase family protein [Planctomycetota bacterium]|nr:carboxymuconolactone decarboxylase family protein [Planctomycetota bacterium]